MDISNIGIERPSDLVGSLFSRGGNAYYTVGGTVVLNKSQYDDVQFLYRN